MCWTQCLWRLSLLLQCELPSCCLQGGVMVASAALWLAAHLCGSEEQGPSCKCFKDQQMRQKKNSRKMVGYHTKPQATKAKGDNQMVMQPRCSHSKEDIRLGAKMQDELISLFAFAKPAAFCVGPTGLRKCWVSKAAQLEPQCSQACTLVMVLEGLVLLSWSTQTPSFHDGCTHPVY